MRQHYFIYKTNNLSHCHYSTYLLKLELFKMMAEQVELTLEERIEELKSLSGSEYAKRMKQKLKPA